VSFLGQVPVAVHSAI